jgi:hypothetical protein
MKTDVVTKVYMQVGEGEEIERSLTSEEAFNKKVAAATEAGKPVPVLLAQQTFQLTYAETIEEALQLSGGDEDIAVTHFNYGSILRQHKAASDLITDDGFQAEEGIKDLAFSIAQKTERKKMTATEKAAKELGIDPAKLQEALALILSQQAASAS